MAKGSSLNLNELKIHCLSLNLNPVPTRNRINKQTGERYKDFSKEDYILALQNYYINKYKEENSFHKSLEWILKMDSPMLALQIKNMSEEVQKEIWNNQDKWIAEEKIDGCRINLCWFHEDNCLDAYSRNTSVNDFLPINYGNKLYDTVDINLLKDIPDFILDCELVLCNNEVKREDNINEVQLNMIAAILSSNYELSKSYQELNPVKLVAFDIIMYDNKDLTNLTLRERKKYLDIIYNKLNNIINIELVPNYQGLSTKEFYNQVVSTGGEGLVVKDLDSKYDIKGKRAGEWIKIKRSVSGSLLESKLGDSIDAFVIGFNRGNGKNKNLVGSLLFGIYILDINGNYILDNNGAPLIHEIAQIGGIADALREAITIYDPINDIVKLRPDVYGKVAEIDGQDISSKQMRFSHAILKYWRMDKTPEQCSLRKDFLEKLIL